MKNFRGLKHYIRMYFIIAGVYFLYISYLAYTNDGYELAVVLGTFYIPLFIILFMYLFDTLFDRIFPTKDKKSKDGYVSFVNKVTAQVNETLEFSIEDFRRLRENDRFQKALYQAYQISEKGETKDINFILLEKKFKKDSNEGKALGIVIEEVKKMM
jgi:hypothetical protein